MGNTAIKGQPGSDSVLNSNNLLCNVFRHTFCAAVQPIDSNSDTTRCDVEPPILSKYLKSASVEAGLFKSVNTLGAEHSQPAVLESVNL